MSKRDRSNVPRARGRFDVSYDPDSFGQFAEGIASFLGTARYLVWQTAFCVVWILYNTLAPPQLQFDPTRRGLVLLTLILSIQASYAAPLILLAQNRQERRDRQQAENDRAVADRTKNDTEFLAREIAGVRLALSDVVTNEQLTDQLADIAKTLKSLSERVDRLSTTTDGEPTA